MSAYTRYSYQLVYVQQKKPRIHAIEACVLFPEYQKFMLKPMYKMTMDLIWVSISNVTLSEKMR